MEIYERIRLLRKEHLRLSQEQFGVKLGVSRSVIANIETNVLARPEQKEPLYRLICSTFNISYAWLTTGEGEMKDITSDDLVDQLAVRHKLDDIDKEILLLYITIPQSHRLSVRTYVKVIVDVGKNSLYEAKAEHKRRIEETRAKNKSHPTGRVIETIIPDNEEQARLLSTVQDGDRKEKNTASQASSVKESGAG